MGSAVLDSRVAGILKRYREMRYDGRKLAPKTPRVRRRDPLRLTSERRRVTDAVASRRY